MPLYDSDSAQERYDQASWKNVELWEKAEIRLRRRKLFWVILTVVLCLVLFSVPVISARLPKWTTLHYARKVAEAVLRVERYALVDRKPHRLRLLPSENGTPGLRAVIEAVVDCETGSARTEEPAVGSIKESIIFGTFGFGTFGRGFRFVTSEEGARQGILGLSDRFCFDPTRGSWAFARQGIVTGLVVASESGAREDWSVVMISDHRGEVRFE